MIFFIRHGERADQCNNQKEIKQIQFDFDPHLTQKGDQMAQKTGKYIYQQIKEYAQSQQIDVNDLTINFMTSPFLRCIQTSINLMKEIPNNKKLYIQDEIGELMYTYDFHYNILNDLHIRTKQHPIVTHQYLNGVEIIKERLFKSNKFIQPQFPENNQICTNRINAFMKELLFIHNTHQNKMKIINICVTHQGIVELIVHLNHGKHEYVDYCGVAQLKLNSINQECKLGISGQSFWQ